MMVYQLKMTCAKPHKESTGSPPNTDKDDDIRVPVLENDAHKTHNLPIYGKESLQTL